MGHARNNPNGETRSALPPRIVPTQTPVAVLASPPTSLSLSPVGAAFIKSWEQGPDGGPALTQYESPEGGADTIGWGHKLKKGEDFSAGITEEQAIAMFDKDSATHQNIVKTHVKVPLTQNQFDALVSLTYNAPKALISSHLLTKLNKGDYNGAASQFLRWNHIGKAVSSGLTIRRQCEKDMFTKAVYINH